MHRWCGLVFWPTEKPVNPLVWDCGISPDTYLPHLGMERNQLCHLGVIASWYSVPFTFNFDEWCAGIFLYRCNRSRHTQKPFRSVDSSVWLIWAKTLGGGDAIHDYCYCWCHHSFGMLTKKKKIQHKYTLTTAKYLQSSKNLLKFLCNRHRLEISLKKMLSFRWTGDQSPFFLCNIS